ncbi:hypothetical protein SAY87_001795 [Trapa incisa]|uniref:Uncharacterized protein n=1 Tax=Trapa incisa TaxID=236973 RepID=A0AAN7PTP6_9MYRT|nr:hypothetical protein SAY87_001795 [Trapa incisa]
MINSKGAGVLFLGDPTNGLLTEPKTIRRIQICRGGSNSQLQNPFQYQGTIPASFANQFNEKKSR